MEDNTICFMKPKMNYVSFSDFFSKNQSRTIANRNTAITNTISTLNKNTNPSKSIGSFSKKKITNFDLTTLDQTKEKHEQSFNIFTNTNGLRYLKSSSFKLRQSNDNITIGIKNERIKKELSDEFALKDIFKKITIQKNRLTPKDNRFDYLKLERNKESESNFDKKYKTQNSYTVNRMKRHVYVRDKINEIQNKLQFMQGVTNLIYPKLVMKKISKGKKCLHNYHSNNKSDLTPCRLNEIAINDRKQRMNDYFTQSIAVMNKSKSSPWLK